MMATVSIMISLSFIVFLQRVTKKPFLSMLGGFLIFYLTNPSLFSKTPLLIVQTVLDKSFFTLVPSVLMIYFLEELLNVSKDAHNLSISVRKLFKGSSKAAASFLPAVIGLLPVPSGAMFSAPIVAQISPDIDNLNKAAMNYWFRHTLEFFWPIYPAMYLLSSIISIPIGAVSMKLFPFFLISFVSGWIWFNGFSIPRVGRISFDDWKRMWPALMIVSIGVAILVFKMDGWLALLLASLIYGGFRRHFVKRALWASLKRFEIILVLLIIFLYKHAVTDFEIGLKMSQELVNFGGGAILLSTVMPAIVGMATGISSTAVGITVPLLLGIGELGHTILAYVFSVIGVLLSPVHLCLILPAEYFQVDFLLILKRILALILLIASISLLLHFI